MAIGPYFNPLDVVRAGPGIAPPPGSSEITTVAYYGTGSGGASPISIVPRDTLNNAAPNITQQQLQTAAAGALIGFGYGRCRVGVRIMFPIVDTTGQLLIPGFIGQGPIDAIESVELDNAALPGDAAHVDYTGAAGQTFSGLLAGAWLARGKVYADALPGIAYTVVSLPAELGYRAGNITATARMLKVYDPRLDSTAGGSGSQRLADSTTWAWSQNPVLALAHFLSTPGFGPEESLDWTTVATCADIADQTLTDGTTTQTRRQIGIFFDRAQSVDAIEETLRSYAGVFVVREDATVRFVPDAAASVVYSFRNTAHGDYLLTETGGKLLTEDGYGILLDGGATHLANYLLDSLEIQQTSRGNSPTVVTVRWTDTTQTPWATQEVTAKWPGVDDGTVPWIESVVDWPGCQSAGMAYREAVRRLNQFQLADTSIRLTGTDEALQIRRGDVVSVTDAEGFSEKPYRVTAVYPTAPGRWMVAGTEYQDGLYSDTVYIGPTIPDSNVPGAATPPQVAGLAVAEEPFYEQFAVVATAARLTWTRPTFGGVIWPLLRDYWVIGSIGGVKQFEFPVLPSGTGTEDAVTPKLRPGELYSFGVYVRSTIATGLPVFIGLRPLGKSSPPSDVVSLAGFSVGGDTFLSWPEATDDDQIHVRYEVRYSATGGTWDAATSVQKTAALHYTVPGVPAGTWRFWVKAIDSVGQYSATAAYVDLTVTDTGPFQVTEAAFTSPTVVQMVRDDIATQPEPRWVSDNGNVMGYGHVDTNDTTGAWIDANVLVGDAFVQPSTVTTSSWTSETYDAGGVLTASWAATLPYRALVGSVDFKLQLSSDGSTWTDYSGGIAVSVAARYAKIVAASHSSGDEFAVDGYGALQIVQVGQGALRPSATTTETVTADTTVTVRIAGADYKLVAKAI